MDSLLFNCLWRIEEFHKAWKSGAGLERLCVSRKLQITSERMYLKTDVCCCLANPDTGSADATLCSGNRLRVMSNYLLIPPHKTLAVSIGRPRRHHKPSVRYINFTEMQKLSNGCFSFH